MGKSESVNLYAIFEMLVRHSQLNYDNDRENWAQEINMGNKSSAILVLRASLRDVITLLIISSKFYQTNYLDM